MDKKKIVILGAGFGGLKTAFGLSRELKHLSLVDRYEVVLVDRNEHHTFTPLLYETATTSRETADLMDLHNLVTHNIAELVKNYSITFLKDELKELHLKEGWVVLRDHGPISVEFVVFALGSEANYMNIPGLKDHSLTLKTFIDAVRIRDRILELTTTQESGIHVVVGGGGPTGVELAAELSNWCKRADYRTSPRLRVTLLEAQPTVLMGFLPSIIKAVQKRLAALHVTVKVNAKISKLDHQNAYLENGERVSFDLFIWTGGVKTPDILLRLPLKRESHGKIEASQTMACVPQTSDLELDCMVYGLGDNVCSCDPKTNRVAPAVAPVALAQASVVIYNIIEDVKEKEGMGPAGHRVYSPIEYPYVVPVGGKYAVAKVGPFVFKGFLGWAIKGLVELHYLVSIMPIMRACRVWFRGLRVFIQNDQVG